MPRVLHNSGLTQFLVTIIVVMFILAYFKIDVRGFIDELPFIKEVFSALWKWMWFVWNSYLAEPIGYFWETIVIDFFWEGILSKML